jgi:gas vesicle protein
MSRDSGVGDFMAGFFVGSLVGATFALLFAPASGDEMREQIKEKSVELKQRAEEMGIDTAKLAEIKDRGQSIVEQQRERFHEAVDEGRHAADRRKEELLTQFQPPTETE